MSKGAAYYEAYWAIPALGRHKCRGLALRGGCAAYVRYRMQMLAR